MKNKLFCLSIFLFFLLMACNKDRIVLKLNSPVEGTIFRTYEDIEVSIAATTKKGSITQVVLTVDTLKTISFIKAPYDTILPKQTFKKEGIYFLSVMAYSSEGVREGTAINIIINDTLPKP
jgi:hypothetical protein